MSTVGTQTKTFTVADIRKVAESFAAVLSMISQSTGLLSTKEIDNYINDVKLFAELNLLKKVHIILKNSAGEQIRGTIFTVSVDAGTWGNDRPGDGLWPKTPGGFLNVVVTNTLEYSSKSYEEKVKFCADNGFRDSWTSSKEDTTFAKLTGSQGQKYQSNGYGMERKNYS